MRNLIILAAIAPLLFACGKKHNDTAAAPPASAAQAASAPVAASAVLPASPALSATVIEEKTPADAAGTHTVAAGDTLYSIAKQHHLNVRDIAKWNNISDPRRIHIGQHLRLTAP